VSLIYVGSDNGPEADSDPLVCLRARSDGYAATCGQNDHCPSCQLCTDVHASDCPERTHAVNTLHEARTAAGLAPIHEPTPTLPTPEVLPAWAKGYLDLPMPPAPKDPR